MLINYDVLIFLGSVLLILFYYLYLARRTRHSPNSSRHVLNSKVREQWVKMIMSNDNKGILAIQTIRNSLIAANFMASTSILLIIGTLNISEKIGKWAPELNFINLGYDYSIELWQLKLCILLLNFAIAFYCFSMAIRLFNHVGYMINLSNDTPTDTSLYQQTCAILNRAGTYYTFGVRCFFFSLPVILWYFGPVFLFLGTLGLVIGLVILDTAPK